MWDLNASFIIDASYNCFFSFKKLQNKQDYFKNSIIILLSFNILCTRLINRYNCFADHDFFKVTIDAFTVFHHLEEKKGVINSFKRAWKEPFFGKMIFSNSVLS